MMAPMLNGCTLGPRKLRIAIGRRAMQDKLRCGMYVTVSDLYNAAGAQQIILLQASLAVQVCVFSNPYVSAQQTASSIF